MTIKKIFLILLSAFVFFNCSEEPTSIGGNLLDEKINVRTITSDSLNQTSAYEHPEEVSFSASERLLLGITDNINASILIKFETALADSIEEDIRNNEVTVTSALVQFQKTYSFGDTLAPFDFTVHKVISNWSVGFTKDSLLNFSYETEDLSPDVPDINDSLTSFAINSQIVLDWLKITADTSSLVNNGVYVKPAEGTNRILGYQALTSSFTDIPVINVVIEKAGSYTDTVTFISTLDITVMDGTIPPVSNGNIPIRAGYLVNSKLFFDLSPLPENISVNKAELVLTIDTLETKVGSSYTNSLLAYFLFDSTNTDSVSSLAVTLSRSDNTFSGNITTFVRSWIANNNNNGLLLRPGSPTTGVELFVIKGSEAVTDKPLLKITYSELK